jgi:hypothetical protein
MTQRESMPMWFGTMSLARRIPRRPARLGSSLALTKLRFHNRQLGCAPVTRDSRHRCAGSMGEL